VSEGFAEVGEERLWYESAGEGFPVVFAHSGLMDARAWAMQFEAFADQHEVVRFDRRGSGRSDAPTGPFSDLRDLRELLSALGIAWCAVVGCAEGAALAIDLALADQVERTVRAGDAEGAIELQLAFWAP
jgi:pimeloyl-ACP methyl ester carboxylesterase